MSAHIVSKQHIDLLVRAAEHAHLTRYAGDGRSLTWWRTDDEGRYAGWRQLARNAETREDDDYKAFCTPSQLGQMLVSENVRSVYHRYPDTDPDAGDLPGPTDAYYMGPYVYEDLRRDLTPGEVFRAIDCLDYQSCEHPEWYASEAYAFLVALRKAYCDRIADAEEAGLEARLSAMVARGDDPRERRSK